MLSARQRPEGNWRRSASRLHRFFPTELEQRYQVIQWLMFQVGSIGPMLGQAYHFKNASETIPYAIESYSDEALKLYGVMEKQLEQNSFLRNEYSIADMVIFPRVAAYSKSLDNLAEFPHVQRWLEQIGDCGCEASRRLS